MAELKLIDAALLDEVSAEAKASPRLRKNRNFHPTDEHPGHRLLNAVEPGTYVRPHCHLDPLMDETMVVLRGCLGLVTFDAAGQVLRGVILGPGAAALGVDIPHGTWHTVLALEPNTVFLEAKAGPYLPLTAEEKSTWAPAEGAPEVAAYLAWLEGLFA